MKGNTWTALCSPGPLTAWHQLLGRLPSSCRDVDAAADALTAQPETSDSGTEDRLRVRRR